MLQLAAFLLALYGGHAGCEGKRSLHQSTGKAQPLSATTAMLIGPTGNDPQGRGTLLAMLGDSAPRYQSAYQWTYTSAHFAVPVSQDPGPGVPPGATPADVGSFQVVGDSKIFPVHAIPFPNDLLLFMTRGNNANGSSDDPLLAVDGGTYSVFAGIYNISDNSFQPYEIREHPFCAAHTLLADGHRAIIAGGDNANLAPPHLINGIQVIRIFDSLTQKYEVVAEMDRGRYYPSVMTNTDGSILILGGSTQEAGGWAGSVAPSDTVSPIVTCSPNAGGSNADPNFDNPSYQIFYPSNNTLTPSLTLTILLQAWPISLYPYAAVLPTGSTLVIAGAFMSAMYLTPDGALQDEAVGLLPSLPIPVSFPQSASITLLELQPPSYSAQVLIAGGSGEFCSSQTTTASSKSFLIDVTPGADHSIVAETTAYPRVMGELTLLPDGKVLLCNGGQVGTAGGAGPNNAAGGVGVTRVELYDPTKPVQQRWSTLGDTGIWRLYHAWAFLTRNATVLIGGSDSTAERRIQEWTPYYLRNGKPRPSLSNTPSSIRYQQEFTFGYAGVPTLDRVVLTRLSTATHGTHDDQRQVVLACRLGSPGTNEVTCSAPPNSNIAPPGMFMLFGLYQGVPSIAPYVLVEP